jgi:hypothetical protein
VQTTRPRPSVFGSFAELFTDKDVWRSQLSVSELRSIQDKIVFLASNFYTL